MIRITYLDNLLHRDDVSGVPQADRLLWGEALEALLHRLQMESRHHYPNSASRVPTATARVVSVLNVSPL